MEKTTLVKFLIDSEGDVFAYFPYLNYSKELYQNRMKISYSHVGQHSGCAVEYAKECKPAKKGEYENLLAEIQQIGYKVKVSPVNLK